MGDTRKHAIVIGGGIGGLAAARAVADVFDDVTLLERDAASTAALPRPGVPQGRQPHLLLGGGFTALEALFPGFGADLSAAGAIPYAAGQDLRCEIPGLGVLPRRDFPIRSHAMTRPLLEGLLQRRLASRGNIRIRHGARAVSIEAAGGKVSGLCLEEEGRFTMLEGDLVIDASGQGLLTLSCLARNGLAAPRESRIGVDLGYACGVFTVPPPAAPDCVAMITLPAAPQSSRGGYMVRIGPDLWQVLLVGRDDDRPPGEIEAFKAFAGTLPTPTIHQAILAGRHHSEPARHRFRGSIWRHFDESGDLPHGLLPLGDALCRFNPVYGQGMTSAAQQALLLQQVLKSRPDAMRRPGQVAAAFFRGARPLLERAWLKSAIPDFLYPQTTGDRPPDLQATLQAQGDAFQRAMQDPVAHLALLQDQHLVQPDVLQEAAA
jgi:2-polyprenyl-6-methoxyphenol hydroxylase-like FAD-dependent oxidoreductase